MIRQFRYEGSGAAIWRIALGNFALAVLTLGIYRFWGAVRVRRQLWSSTRFEEDAFEYSGTGGELMRGFLLALLVIGVPLVGLNLFGEYLAGRGEYGLAGIVSAAAYIFTLMMAAAGIYRARRYRLGRTRWRGIRGGLRGSAWVYAWRWAFCTLAVALSLGLAYPWTRMVLARYVWNNTELGNFPCVLSVSAWPLFKRWLAVWILIPPAAILPFALFFAILVRMGQTAASEMPGWLLPLALPAVLLLPFVFLWYKAHEWRAIAQHLQWGAIRFGAEFRTARFIWLTVTNLLIVLLTLGIGFAYAMHRRYRFACDALTVEGQVDFEAILQNQAARQSHGEGLVSLLDAE